MKTEPVYNRYISSFLSNSEKIMFIKTMYICTQLLQGIIITIEILGNIKFNTSLEDLAMFFFLWRNIITQIKIKTTVKSTHKRCRHTQWLVSTIH